LLGRLALLRLLHEPQLFFATLSTMKHAGHVLDFLVVCFVRVRLGGL
jgi:hypothetical protein